MKIDGSRGIIDYIIDQAERYDGINLEIEDRIIHDIRDAHSEMRMRILQIIDVHGDITSTLRYQSLMNRIQMVVESFYSEAYKILISTVEDYTVKGYSDFGDLIDIGFEVEGRAKQEFVTEMSKHNLPDPNAVEFMRNHAFEMVRDISNDIVNQMKTRLGGLLVQGRTNKGDVRSVVEEIMQSSRSRADMIAQTELSMAYNHGALQRMNEFNAISTQKIMKYWHGFKYSAVTCTYCRPRIGNTYHIDDSTEVLPAHPRCRCVWLPFVDGWDKPISTVFTRNANMINRVYSPSEIYGRINKRLNINYADYLSKDDALGYMAGDRSTEFYAKLAQARDVAIKDKMKAFDVASAKTDEAMSREFNIQVPFWKRYVAQSMVDNNTKQLVNAKEAIKGVMILPWTGRQLKEWSKLIDMIDDNMKD